MKIFRLARLRLRSLFYRDRMEQELADELQFHLSQRAAQLAANGLAESESRRHARLEFGNVTLHAEECRDTRKLNLLESTIIDIRYAIRSLLRARVFSAVSIASLAIGIGALTAVYAVFDLAVLHPLPVSDPDRLLWFREYAKAGQESGGNPSRFEDWSRLRSFDSVAGFYGEGAILTGAGKPVRLSGLLYIGNIDRILKARLRLGRFPNAAEVKNGDSVVVLTAATWRTLFAGDPHVLGRSFRLANQNCQIIGVLDESVSFPSDVQFWKPIPPDVQRAGRIAGFLSQVGRLANGASLAGAQAEVNTVLPQLAKREPGTDEGRNLRLQLLAEHESSESRGPLLLFLIAGGGVLLIACVNVAGLLLARGLNRQRESSIRVALGAGYAPLLRLFLIEASLIALAGCCFGLLCADAFLQLLKSALPEETPLLAQASLGWRPLCFAFFAAVAAAVLSGLLPAWKSARQAIASGLKQGAMGSIGAGTRLRGFLVVGQVAASLLLLIGAGLLLTSFLRLSARPLGFQSAHAFTFSVNFPWDTPSDALNETARRVLEKIAASPGVESAGVVDRLPLHGGSQSRRLLIDNTTVPPALDVREFGWRVASSGYFAAVRVPVFSGRLFRDGEKHECLITQHLASQLFGQADPLGHEIASRPAGQNRPTFFRIVGVVGNTPLEPSATAGASEVYLPWGADYWPMLNFVLRTRLTGADVSRLIRQVAATTVPDQVIDNVGSLADRTSETRLPFRNRALLALALASVALALSAVGLFALLMQDSELRTKEYGVRATFGANRLHLAWEALGRGLRLSASGVLLGLLAAAILSKQLRAFLFDLQPLDGATYAAASGVLLFIALLAAIIPAVRSSRADPLVSLRHE